jgi:outer membrane protein assembly factor BamA
VQGPANSEQTWLLGKARSLRARFTGGLLKPGKPYSAERIAVATKLIKRSLAQQHRLASKVLETPPQYHADTNRVDVSFNVEGGPAVMIRTTGARLSSIPFMSGREMKKLIPNYSEGTIDNDLVQEGQQKSCGVFREEGVLRR